MLASSPVDTAVFLNLAGIWSWQLFALGCGSKVLAGALISLGLRQAGEAKTRREASH